MPSAISEMPVSEQYTVDEDPDLLRAASMTGSIRWLEIYRSYLLSGRLDKADLSEHDQIIESWGRNLGITPGTLASHLRWARMINVDDLLSVFTEEAIQEAEWTARIGTSHLKIVARATEQKTHRVLSSREMAEWIRRAFHANLSVAELETALRDNDLLPPKRGAKSKPIEKGALTGCALLESVSQHLKAEGKDFPLKLSTDTWDKPVKAHKVIWRLAQLVERLYPDAVFSLNGEGKSQC